MTKTNIFAEHQTPRTPPPPYLPEDAPGEEVPRIEKDPWCLIDDDSGKRNLKDPPPYHLVIRESPHNDLLNDPPDEEKFIRKLDSSLENVFKPCRNCPIYCCEIDVKRKEDTNEVEFVMVKFRCSRGAVESLESLFEKLCHKLFRSPHITEITNARIFGLSPVEGTEFEKIWWRQICSWFMESAGSVMKDFRACLRSQNMEYTPTWVISLCFGIISLGAAFYVGGKNIITRIPSDEIRLHDQLCAWDILTLQSEKEKNLESWVKEMKKFMDRLNELLAEMSKQTDTNNVITREERYDLSTDLYKCLTSGANLVIANKGALSAYKSWLEIKLGESAVQSLGNGVAIAATISSACGTGVWAFRTWKSVKSGVTYTKLLPPVISLIIWGGIAIHTTCSAVSSISERQKRDSDNKDRLKDFKSVEVQVEVMGKVAKSLSILLMLQYTVGGRKLQFETEDDKEKWVNFMQEINPGFNADDLSSSTSENEMAEEIKLGKGELEKVRDEIGGIIQRFAPPPKFT